MGLAKVSISLELSEISCGECGGVYAITERYRQQKYDKSGFWHCPYCQCSWGYGKGELQRKQEELDAEKRRLQLALTRENEERAAKEKALRKLKRVGRGVCPECNRTFENLAKHMNCKHGAGDHGKVGKAKLP